eukprot:6202837-Pleurochrysis_carterae.AAC.1
MKLSREEEKRRNFYKTPALFAGKSPCGALGPSRHLRRSPNVPEYLRWSPKGEKGIAPLAPLPLCVCAAGQGQCGSWFRQGE